MERKNRYKILTVVGARPQFIKAAALSRAIAIHDQLYEVIVHSGQHYNHNLSESFFTELNIPTPKYNLGIGSKSHNNLIGEFLILFDAIIDKENPDIILVYGDTNTTAAAAIAAAKRNIPLVHVEAGLREFDKSIPEEVNKLITDSITDIYFCPTQTGVNNLKKEGKTEQVYLTGDISLDLLFRDTKYLTKSEVITKYKVPGDYIFMTCHRVSNTSDAETLGGILSAVSSCNRAVIFPLHPRTKAAINKYNLTHLLGENITIVDPLGFWETQSILKHSALAVTDSGGIIKEAYFHKVPGIIIDTQTEWIETIDEGWNTIVGPNQQAILKAIANTTKPSIHTNALGNGTCGSNIVDIIVRYLEK
ncbi:MAG: UDP-N-acetylglucosamine 2-epimerase (non-hydrolyzing) [Saprospiraceae bacterium]